MEFKNNDVVSIETKLPMKLLYINGLCISFVDISSDVIDRDNKSITTVCNSESLREVLNVVSEAANEFGYVIIASKRLAGFTDDPTLKIRVKDSMLSNIKIGDVVLLKMIYIGCIVNEGSGNIFIVCDSIELTGNKVECNSVFSLLDDRYNNFYCYSCGNPGHYANTCTKIKANECFRCGSIEHLAKDCVMKDNRETNARCYKCDTIGHYSKNCPNTKSLISNKNCFECGKKGHFANECQKPKRCYRCGESDHFVKDCSNS